MATFDQEREYAFGPTPMYSVSKAFLNVGTKLLQSAYEKNKRSRVIAVCPGNFLSPMSTAEETLDAICVGQAASSIISLVDKPWNSVLKGGFYRYQEPISW